MDTKLTLKLDKTVIEKAKEYASSHKRSLSGLIESYLKTLVDRDTTSEIEEVKISPFVEGMMTGVHIPADIDYKKVYVDHLSEKYK